MRNGLAPGQGHPCHGITGPVQIDCSPFSRCVDAVASKICSLSRNNVARFHESNVSKWPGKKVQFLFFDHKTDDNDIDHDHIQYNPKQQIPPQIPRCKLQFVYISKEWNGTLTGKVRGHFLCVYHSVILYGYVFVQLDGSHTSSKINMVWMSRPIRNVPMKWTKDPTCGNHKD